MDFDKEFKKTQKIALITGTIFGLFIMIVVCVLIYILYKWLLN